MARKTDKTKALFDAVAEQSQNLDPAQREFVLAQLEHYRWNEWRIAELERMLEEGVGDPDEEGRLFRQRHQLVAEQGTLFSHIMRWLKGTNVKRSELDEFLA